jgi:predicted nuclease of restriction endonuclease-like (RecB) superfamily
VHFTHLQQTLSVLDESFRLEAGKSVNRLLTLRNWLVGFYIVEFEQRGEDRAEYGERLLERLAEGLDKKHFSHRNLKLFRQFYFAYPQFLHVASALPIQKRIRQTLSDELQSIDSQIIEIGQTVSAQSDIPSLPPQQLVNSLSFSHFVLIMSVENPLARAFYEVESIRGNWSVRELKRQIGSLLYERTGMTQDKDELLRRVHQKADALRPADFLRSPYLFDFLGFPEGKLVDESTLEQALLDHLQDFLLELGTGFCFEARQKRILIGDDWHYVDLVFYHRLLKCHVLVDLKVEDFKLDHAGQINGYVNFFKENVQAEGDNPPVGLLLCTGRHEAAVRYALGGLDENLFVRQYRLYLPDEADLKAFIEREKEMRTL